MAGFEVSTEAPDAAVGTDVADFEAIGILESGQLGRHRPGRGRVARRGRLLIERLMRALVIELVAKRVEAALLSGQAACGRARGGRFQGAVHALVPSILVRPPRLDELGQ